jgi:uncharacterized protein involved in outer membrane biogenesis
MKKQKRERHPNKKKSTLKKAVIGTMIVLAVAVGAVVVLLLTNLNAIVKAAIEKFGSEATLTAVRVDKVRISLKQGSGAIYGFTVGNPKGFDTPHAFSLGEIGVKIDLRSLSGEVMIINEIVVRGPKVFVEMNADKAVNLNELKKNLAQSMPSKPGAPSDDGKKGKEPKLIIRRVRFSEGSIFVKIVPQNNKEYRINLPALEMNNLGGQTGATPTQIARQVLGELTRRVLDEVRKKGMDMALEKAQDKAKSLLRDQSGDMLKGIFR